MKLKLIDTGDGSGDAFLEIPPELLEQLGWQEGDQINIGLIKNRSGEIELVREQSSDD